MHDYTMPVGPQHPSLKESMCLRLSLDGNYVQDAYMRLGYMHKGIEKMIEGKNIEQAMYIVQRICGICSSAYDVCFVQAIEKMLDYNAPKKVKDLRVLMNELSRIHSHLLWTGVMLHEIGYDTLFMYFWREREKVLDCLEKISGGRVHFNMNKVRTMRYDLAEGDKEFILHNLESVEKNTCKYMSEIKKDHVINMRFKNVGTLNKEQARKVLCTGPNARASGLLCDVRKHDPYESYKDFKFDETIEKDGDSRARVIIRLREILESIKIIKQLLNNFSDEKIPAYSLTQLKQGQDFSRVEAPRGELFHFITIKDSKVVRARLRPPTLIFIQSLNELLKGVEIGDVPVIVGSLDPCFSCLERVMVLKNNKKEMLNEKQFRKRYVDV